jgi:uncharacterized protein (TIGR02246 family)
MMLGAAALALSLGACDRAGMKQEASIDVGAARQAVIDTEQSILAAFEAKDPAKLTSYYASDAVVSMPGRAAAKGTEAIGKINSEDMADPNFRLTFANEHTDVAASGDMAYTRGTFNVTFTHPETKQAATEQGNYLTVFKKQADGSWKAVSDYAVPSG